MASLTATAAPLRSLECDPEPFVRRDRNGLARIELAVKGAHCANCMSRIEGGLKALDGVEDARLNLSTGKLAVRWDDARVHAPAIIALVETLGFQARPYDPHTLLENEDAEGRFLLRCMAVAGFASANVMLLSISIWSGVGGEMGEGTRTLFHWLSGLIAIPAAIYAGRPFFRSASKSLSAGHANMDVPISLAILLALALSIYATVLHRPRAYFDAAVMLPFLLLLGRYLDFLLRRKARGAARELVAMQAVTSRRIDADGIARPVAAADIVAGDRLLLATGERVPVDGTLEDGATEADLSLVTGESTPVRIAQGNPLRAGAIVTGRPAVLRAMSRVEDSFVAELARLVETGQQHRNRYVKLADRAARIYVPVVHTLAAIVFLTWLAVLHAGFAVSLERGISLLIITCPCALGLAVPAVQIVATGLLFRRGVLVKSGDALERLAEVDVALFDKTGTLTLGRPALVNQAEIGATALEDAARLARASRHPLARAVVDAAGTGIVAKDAHEIPGCGIEAIENGECIRLGRADWVGVPGTTDGASSELWYRRGDAAPVCFAFQDRARTDAPLVMASLKRRNIDTKLLSGDRATVAQSISNKVGIVDWRAGVDPAQKLAAVGAIANQGHRVLMVGDGLNDAAALAAAHVSISPGSAVDAAQAEADMVLLGEDLLPVVAAIDVSRQARRRVLENFWFAAAYNVIAVPLAALGFVTPLIAAVAMASSSLIVTLNALRLRVPAP
jgi:Cu2+-exporting ATPase